MNKIPEDKKQHFAAAAILTAISAITVAILILCHKKILLVYKWVFSHEKGGVFVIFSIILWNMVNLLFVCKEIFDCYKPDPTGFSVPDLMFSIGGSSLVMLVVMIIFLIVLKLK